MLRSTALASLLLLASVTAAFALAPSTAPAPSKQAGGQSTPAAPATAAPAAPAAPAAAPAPSVIPVAEIPVEADRLLTTLRAFEDRAAPGAAALEIEAGLPAMARRVEEAKIETKGLLERGSSLTLLTNLSDQWAGIQKDLRAWAELLKRRSADLGTVLDGLATLTDTWTRTRAAAVSAKAPPAVLTRVDEALSAIAATRARVTAGQSWLLTLQVKVGEQLAAAELTSEQVAESKTADLATLLHRGQPPLWRAWSEGPALADFPARVRESAAPQLDVLKRFTADHLPGMGAHVVLFVVLFMFALAARRRVLGWQAAGTADRVLSVLELPMATALVATLLLGGVVFDRPPMIVLNVLGMVLLIPIVRLLSRLTRPASTAAIWAAATLFVLNRLRDVTLENSPVLDQCAVFLLATGTMVTLSLLQRRRALVVGSYTLPAQLVWLTQAILAVSAAAAAFGYVRLARLLGGGVMRSGYVALEFYTAGLVALALFFYLLRVPPLSRIHMVANHRGLFERRALVLVFWVLGLLWLGATLRWFSLYDPLWRLGDIVLESRLTRGFVSLSLGDILAFVATVWIAFLVSRFVRFVLEEDVFPRLPLGRGLPYAISSLLHYLILLLGFLAAVGAMGVDLNRVTLLTGAFGVGVGFGLQTIVNNFVSGIILLLERPIQVGDAIQMTDLDGEVRRIGIRSTTVHTWRGAEVIVPNATLISGNLTNWTLSDRTRRFELPVGVAYGTDPRRVIDLLREAAASVPGVLKNPGPIALFQGFGDSALNFEVRAWTARFEEWAAIHSEVAVAVNAALKTAGIEVPFPQRDLTLRFPSQKET